MRTSFASAQEPCSRIVPFCAQGPPPVSRLERSFGQGDGAPPQAAQGPPGTPFPAAPEAGCTWCSEGLAGASALEPLSRLAPNPQAPRPSPGRGALNHSPNRGSSGTSGEAARQGPARPASCWRGCSIKAAISRRAEHFRAFPRGHPHKNTARRARLIGPTWRVGETEAKRGSRGAGSAVAIKPQLRLALAGLHGHTADRPPLRAS